MSENLADAVAKIDRKIGRDQIADSQTDDRGYTRREHAAAGRTGDGQSDINATPPAGTSPAGGAVLPRDPVSLPARVAGRSTEAPATQYMSPMPPGIPPPAPPPDAPLGSGFSTTTVSVVSSSPAMEAAFWSAVRVTLVGSITPASTRSS